MTTMTILLSLLFFFGLIYLALKYYPLFKIEEKRKVVFNDKKMILDEDDYLVYNGEAYGASRVALINKDKSLSVYYGNTKDSIFFFSMTEDMRSRIDGRIEQAEKEIVALINIGVIKKVRFSEVPIYTPFLLDTSSHTKVKMFLSGSDLTSDVLFKELNNTSYFIKTIITSGIIKHSKVPIDSDTMVLIKSGLGDGFGFGNC